MLKKLNILIIILLKNHEKNYYYYNYINIIISKIVSHLFLILKNN